VRDVSVTVGSLDIVERDVAGVRVHVGAPRDATSEPLERWAEEVDRAIRDIAEHLGPFPYADLWVSVLPDQTSGIEHTGAIQFGDRELDDGEWIVTHEVAHMWFYGLVGNDQATHPWLDESFASFVEVLVDEDSDLTSTPIDPDVAGHVGEPMAFWEEYRRPSAAYVEGVYVAGGAALAEARDSAGDEEFDEALRAYLAANAHEIAEPADVEEAFAGLPAVLSTLRDAGALPAEPR